MLSQVFRRSYVYDIGARTRIRRRDAFKQAHATGRKFGTACANQGLEQNPHPCFSAVTALLSSYACSPFGHGLLFVVIYEGQKEIRSGQLGDNHPAYAPSEVYYECLRESVRGSGPTTPSPSRDQSSTLPVCATTCVCNRQLLQVFCDLHLLCSVALFFLAVQGVLLNSWKLYHSGRRGN